MPRSMTGYGTAEGEVSGGRLAVEIRTVNHRHLNVQLKLPAALQHLEGDLRARVGRRLERGHVTVGLRWVETPPTAATVRVDLARARALVDALTQLREELGLAGEIDVGFVARQPDVLSLVESDTAVDTDAVGALLDRSLDAVSEMRAREGAALAGELLARLAAIEEHVAGVAARTPARLETERQRLRNAVRELMDGADPDEARLAQEIAILADKLDVTEEIVRLRAHLAAARAALEAEGAVGRRLAFLGQEMLREVNTIGSKANDAAIVQAAVAMKEELEKYREQVENLE